MIPCQTEDFKKMYKKVVGAENVTLSVKEGEILGFIGPNGAGKTTTIRAIMGLIKATSGEVSIINQKAFTQGHIARMEVGYAGGECSFLPNLSVKENIELVAKVKKVGLDRLDELASRLDLNLTRKAKELSLGNKKKLTLIMALINSPKLIVLDEPTVGLDPIVKQEFFKILQHEKKRGASILLSSHELNDVQRICDRVAIIKNGKVIAIEQMEELKTKRLKKITVETDYSTPQITLSGVSNLKQEGNLSTFNYNGNMPKLIKYLNSIDLVNIDISDCDLEDLFIHFYE